MTIPKQYLDIKEYFTAIHDMEAITAAFDNSNKTSKVVFTHDDKYFIALVTMDNYFTNYHHYDAPRNQVISCYMNKFVNAIKITFLVKASFDNRINNFVMTRLYDRLYSIYGKQDIKIAYEYIPGQFNRVSIELWNKENYVSSLSQLFPTIDAFNNYVFDHLLSQLAVPYI